MPHAHWIKNNKDWIKESKNPYRAKQQTDKWPQIWLYFAIILLAMGGFLHGLRFGWAGWGALLLISLGSYIGGITAAKRLETSDINE